MHVDAEIYLKDGPSFLHRHLPFWIAVWVGRFVKMVIPLLVILIPLFAYIPLAKKFLITLEVSSGICRAQDNREERTKSGT
ncbi:hypothetical protein [Polynucleobacter necessarius]|uniref:hypothetical protein n=1 Tax=Polynucleobacter necessarius TaxID=576610 RepID=UPI001E4029EB|nr:hypothetical protein [Polynucleobacter necessarius]